MVVQKYEDKVTLTPAEEWNIIELEREFALLDKPEVNFDKNDTEKVKINKMKKSFDLLLQK